MSAHRNSTAALQGEQQSGRLRGRTQRILDAARSQRVGTGGRFTDRQMMKALELPEPNAVRPRITELVQIGLLIECDQTVDQWTGKKVRVCRAATIREVQRFQEAARRKEYDQRQLTLL